MKKLFVSVIAFVALLQVSYAQDKVFAKDDKVVSASLGFVNTIYTGSGWTITSPPISLTGEYGIVDGLINGKASIGAGIELGYAGMKYSIPSKSYNYSNLILGTKGAFHYQFIDKLDTYASLIIGYDIVSGESNYATSNFIWGCYIGARYYFTHNFAVMTEIGDTFFLLNIGVAYKF
jgi:hypothetical protein